MTRGLFLSCAFLCLLGAACSMRTPEVPTPIAVAGPPTLTPWHTPTSPEGTTLTPSATHQAGLRLPVGTPLPEWNGIPVYASAIAGEESPEGGYTYTVFANPEEILDFYEAKMERLGWEVLSGGMGDIGGTIGFRNDTGFAFILAMPLDSPEGLLYVQITLNEG